MFSLMPLLQSSAPIFGIVL